jgi:hypothetical protein
VKRAAIAIRRAATAMREDFSNDVFRLAIVALQAAIRTPDDLLELQRPDHPAPARRPAAMSALPPQADVACAAF